MGDAESKAGRHAKDRNKRAPAIDDRTAIHEAGHAVANILLDLPFIRVSLRRLSRNLGGGMTAIYTEGIVFDDATLARRAHDRESGRIDEADFTSSMAGPMAEGILLDHDIDDEWLQEAQLDRERIRLTLEAAGKADSTGEIAEKHLEAALELLTEHWPAVVAVAEELKEKRSLTRNQVVSIVERKDGAA